MIRIFFRLFTELLIIIVIMLHFNVIGFYDIHKFFTGRHLTRMSEKRYSASHRWRRVYPPRLRSFDKVCFAKKLKKMLKKMKLSLEENVQKFLK